MFLLPRTLVQSQLARCDLSRLVEMTVLRSSTWIAGDAMCAKNVPTMTLPTYIYI